jgi:hypothetical protein
MNDSLEFKLSFDEIKFLLENHLNSLDKEKFNKSTPPIILFNNNYQFLF